MAVADDDLEPPTMEELEEMVSDGICAAACSEGCMVEVDGECEHGKKSWIEVLFF